MIETGITKNPKRSEFTNPAVYDQINWTPGAYGAAYDRDGWLGYAINPKTKLIKFVGWSRDKGDAMVWAGAQAYKWQDVDCDNE